MRARKRRKKNQGLSKKELWKSIRADERLKKRQKMDALKLSVKEARERRRAAIRSAIAGCREARETYRKLARESCDAGGVDLSVARAGYRKARQALLEEEQHRRELRAIAKSARGREKERKKTTAAEKRGESDDEVRQNIPRDLVPLFERVKRGIKGSTRKSRTEEFLEYVEEHPDEAYADSDDVYERAAREMGERSMSANPKRKNPGIKIGDRVVVASWFPSRYRLDTRGKHIAAGEKGTVTATDSSKAGKRARVQFDSDQGGWFDENTLERIASNPKPKKKRARKRNAGGFRKRSGFRFPKPITKRDRAEAKAKYRREHWGQRGNARVSRAKAPKLPIAHGAAPKGTHVAMAPDPRAGTLVELGKLVEIRWKDRAQGGRAMRMKFDRPGVILPRLSHNETGLVVVGGSYRLPWKEKVPRSVTAHAGTFLVDHGELLGIVYRTRKGADPAEGVDYDHDFGPTRPRLAHGKGGIVIVGGSYKVTERGIVG